MNGPILPTSTCLLLSSFSSSSLFNMINIILIVINRVNASSCHFYHEQWTCKTISFQPLIQRKIASSFLIFYHSILKHFYYHPSFHYSSYGSSNHWIMSDQTQEIQLEIIYTLPHAGLVVSKPIEDDIRAIQFRNCY